VGGRSLNSTTSSYYTTFYLLLTCQIIHKAYSLVPPFITDWCYCHEIGICRLQVWNPLLAAGYTQTQPLWNTLFPS